MTTAFQFGGDHRCTVWRWRPLLHSLAVTIASQQLGGGDRYSISSCFLFGFKSGCFRGGDDRFLIADGGDYRCTVWR